MSKNSDRIVNDFKKLKEMGLKAKNPDQSSAMYRTFRDVVYACHWKCFHEEDIAIMFKAALEDKDIKEKAENLIKENKRKTEEWKKQKELKKDA